MNETGKEKKITAFIGIAALATFILTVVAAAFMFILTLLDTAKIIELSPLVAYMLGDATAHLLALSIQLTALTLIIKAIGTLRNKWKTHNKQQQ
ncbi:MAG: hypothetical protein JHC26_11590 [Thermofilum sp.]|uniref:hypothetical protein n=1 Tax=Thermofilum sp. TaxID=1961369 RepID=UPI002584B39B|nr:hypothetical protein [Thermofilum sp.]MCI4409725.1 hypothetical protein [Thermofilum sp.]